MQVIQAYATLLAAGWLVVSVLFVGFLGLTQYLANRHSERMISELSRKASRRGDL